MTEAFLKSVDEFVARTGVDVVQFKKGERKDEVTQDYLARLRGTEGVLYVGKAQEKARVMRTEAAAQSAQQEGRIRGLSRPRRWSTTSTSIVWMRTSVRCS